MKKVFPIIAISSLFGATSLYAQCSVSEAEIDDGSIIYSHRKELLFDQNLEKNGNFINGVQLAYIQLFAIENGNGLKVGFSILSGASSTTNLVTPRKVWFNFEDGTRLTLSAQRLEGKRFLDNGSVVEVAYFSLNTSQLNKILSNSLNSSVIKDSRTNSKLVSWKVYKDLIKEQANCILGNI